jgi:peptidoglycan/xylan/chitin deacetylase (PgdA/CDA1 family)
MLVRQKLKRVYENGLTFLHSVKPFKKQGIVILLYHNIGNGDVIASKKQFEEQMIFLKDNYRILKLDELISVLKNNKATNENYAAVTFDDGYRDNFEIAYPVLMRLNIPATLFLTPSYLDSNDAKYLTWDMAKEMVKSGLISVGNHAYNHPVLSELKKEAQEHEIKSGKQRLEDMLNIEITSFAYPYGQITHYSKDTIDILRKNGYNFAVTAFPKKNNNLHGSIYEIPRIPIDGVKSLEEFEIRLSNFWGTIQWHLTRSRR